jgi:hypothetical protein
MKSKLSLKVLGVVITLATLASLLVGITAAPAGVSAATNQMVFTPYSLPSNLNYFVSGAGTPAFAAGATTTTTFNTPPVAPNISAVVASADGNTIYAWDSTNKVLYESTNGGKAWNALGIYVQSAAVLAAAAAMVPPQTDNFVGLKMSPKFATDGSVVLAYGQEVWLITGGLANAVSITGDLPTKLEGGTISAVDVGSYYTNGVLAIYIGVNGGGNVYSNVLVFQTGGFTWAPVGNLGSAGSGVGSVTITVQGSLYNSVGVGAGPIAVPALNQGSGYTVAPVVTFSGPTETGGVTATGTATLNGTGGVASITVTLPGSGYTAAPTVSFSAGTLGVGGVAATPFTSAIAVLPVATVTFAPPTGTINPITATGTVTVSTAGAVTVVTVTNPGSGYLAPPTFVTINGNGSGTGATATASLSVAVTANVIGLKLSPNYQSDAEVMAVYTDGVNTYLDSNIAALGWNSSILPRVTLLPGLVATSAVINSGTDYFANSTGTVLVGIGGTTTIPTPPATGAGLYIVKGRVAAPGTVTNLPLAIGTAVTGITFQGPLATSTVLVSTANVTNLNITTAVTASPPTWVDSAAYRGATGTAITSMVYAGTNNAKLFVSSNGSNGAVNLSMDNGNTFNQIGLINAPIGVAKSFAILSSTNWYCRAANGLCQSTDGGVSWVRIFGNFWGGSTAAVAGMARSTTFATDNTFILNNGTNIALITTNGGSTYSPIGAPIAIGGLSMIENAAYYLYSKTTDPAGPALYVSTRPYVNATFNTTVAVPGIGSVTRSGKDATHMTYAIGTTDGRVFQSTDGGVTFNQVGTGQTPGVAGTGGLNGDIEQVSYTSDGTLWAFSNSTYNGVNPSTAMPTPGIFQWVPATSSWLNIDNGNFTGNNLMGKSVANFTVAGDGTAYATVDFAGTTTTLYPGSTYVSPVTNQGVFRSLNYNTINGDGTTGATWAQISPTNFPNGSATASIGVSAPGYPGVALNTFTNGISVAASAASGNTLMITERTSTVSGSNCNGAIYSFVDSYTTGPVVVSPKDKTILATDTYATFTWTAMNGPAGANPASATSTNYDVQVTASTDFTGATTPVFDTASLANTGTQTMDYYLPGNTTASMGVNPGTPTYALKGGTNYSWRVMATSPLPSRWSTQTFTTALSVVNPTPVAVNAAPANGATGVDVNTTFTWPAVSGTNVTYEFVIAEETGQTDKFAIIDYSATCPTNATPLRETLKYNTQYWWRVRATNGTVTSGWSTFFFTTEAAPVITTANTQPLVTIPPATSTVITITQPVTSITLTQPSNSNSIPPALLWAVIAIGAILIIAVIVLIVRTRRIP